MTPSKISHKSRKFWKKTVKFNNYNSSNLSLGHSPLPLAPDVTRALQIGHDISVSVCTLIGLVFSLLFRTFHRSLAAISQLRQARRLFQSRPPITHLHSLCHEPHSAYRSAFNIPYMWMLIHALCRSINNYRHSLTMQQRADAFPGRCIKQD